jgi:hypothetical protein
LEVKFRSKLVSIVMSGLWGACFTVANELNAKTGLVSSQELGQGSEVAALLALRVMRSMVLGSIEGSQIESKLEAFAFKETGCGFMCSKTEGLQEDRSDV